MSAARRKQIAWRLRGAAFAALPAYLAGWYASRPGGLVVVDQWLNHPVLLVGAAVVLVVASLIIELEFRTRVSQIGCAAGLVALIFGSPMTVFTVLATTGFPGRTTGRPPRAARTGC
ncbi:hypothetical protein [Kitasatospora sp. NPDC006786]|uniref:hypothetical protein n=1 Tax=unclassified Kitasatospora TaxID=2633591 RepID=UPI003402EDAC